MYHSGVIYLKLQFEVLVLGNKTQVLRDLYRLWSVISWIGRSRVTFTSSS